MTWNLFLDDERTPPFTAPDYPDYIIARTALEAQALILGKGMPEFITFDHDLGETSEDGSYLASWIIQADLDGHINIPDNFSFNVHSMNPVGAANIKSKIDGYLKFKKEQKQMEEPVVKEFKRTVMVFITYQDRVLLMYHKKYNKWMGFGGHIDENEMVHDAVVREVKEESGLDVKLIVNNVDERATFIQPPFAVCRYDSEKKIEEDYIYRIEVDKATFEQEISGEDIESLWLPMSVAIETLEMFKNTKILLENIYWEVRKNGF